MALTCDLTVAAQRRDDLDAYMTRHVLGPQGFCCSSGTACRASATAQKAPIDFAEGQLSHLGKYYELAEGGVMLRILVIAMETGRLDSAVTLAKRREQVLGSAALPPRSRNPHMIGVTHALRTLHGREMGDDVHGERLDFEQSCNEVHVFDAYAMANVRLCTSVKEKSTQSRPTRVMTTNCVRHMRETIRILQPTVCVVQGTPIPKALAPILTRRVELSTHLADVTIGDVDTLMAEFSHPAAHGDLNWGRWTNMPYLDRVVIPTLQQARRRLGLPASRGGPSSG